MAGYVMDKKDEKVRIKASSSEFDPVSLFTNSNEHIHYNIFFLVGQIHLSQLQ